MDDPLTDDALTGRFRVWQRKKGHRYSLDDVATAHAAVLARPDARRYLDLGCGIGSVLLMVSHKLEGLVQIQGLEAQRASVDLAQRNADRNGVPARIARGDLRDSAAREQLGGPFDLITGTPPYFPLGTASIPPDPQKAHARHELRGGIEDYMSAAASLLAPGGRFVVCGDARRPDRALGGGAAAGLTAQRRRDVVPRAGKRGPLFTLWVMGRAEDCADGQTVVEPALVARDAEGSRTEASHALREFFDLVVDRSEPASPGMAR